MRWFGLLLLLTQTVIDSLCAYYAQVDQVYSYVLVVARVMLVGCILQGVLILLAGIRPAQQKACLAVICSVQILSTLLFVLPFAIHPYFWVSAILFLFFKIPGLLGAYILIPWPTREVNPDQETELNQGF